MKFLVFVVHKTSEASAGVLKDVLTFLQREKVSFFVLDLNKSAVFLRLQESETNDPRLQISGVPTMLVVDTDPSTVVKVESENNIKKFFKLDDGKTVENSPMRDQRDYQSDDPMSDQRTTARVGSRKKRQWDTIKQAALKEADQRDKDVVKTAQPMI